MTQNLNGRIVVVTGAVGGIGAALLRGAAAGGASLVAADRAEATAERAGEILAGYSADWTAIRADLASQEGAQQVIDHTLEKHGHLDVLVNNAGGGIIKPFLDHTEETMRETVARNLWTNVYCTRAALPPMMEAGWGRIINIGADSVRNGLFDHAMYNAAKGGVHGLTTGLAREFAQYGITVNTVAPTGTETPTVLSRPSDSVERYEKTRQLNPMKRFATVEEVASAALYLASEEAGFITGQVISVNGGSAML